MSNYNDNNSSIYPYAFALLQFTEVIAKDSKIASLTPPEIRKPLPDTIITPGGDIWLRRYYVPNSGHTPTDDYCQALLKQIKANQENMNRVYSSHAGCLTDVAKGQIECSVDCGNQYGPWNIFQRVACLGECSRIFKEQSQQCDDIYQTQIAPLQAKQKTLMNDWLNNCYQYPPGVIPPGVNSKGEEDPPEIAG